MAKKSSYWQDREEQERRWQMKQLADDERYIGQIRSQYEAAIRRINDDINNQLQWLSTRSGQPYAEMQKEVDNLDIQRASQDAQKLVGRANQLRGQGHRVTYGDFTSEENARMRLYNATMRINRLEFLKSEVGLELTQLTGELNASLGLKLTDDARKEFKRQAGIMGEQLGNAKPWTSFQPQVLVMKNVQGGNWSQRLWKNQDVLKANLDAVLSAGFISGESNQKMAQRLRKAVRSTMENQRYATERLVRTESARVAYEVQRESIEANGFKWVEWFAEPSACTVCARLARVDNGEGPGIYPLKKVPKIPQDTHPNCRCSIGSYYSDKMLDKKLDELGFEKKKPSASSSNDDVLLNKYLNNSVIKALGRDTSLRYVKSLDSAPEYMKKMYSKFSEKLAIEAVEDTTDERCFYDPKSKKVTLDKKIINMNGKNPDRMPVDVVFHEFGHLIDSAASNYSGFTMSMDSRLRDLLDNDWRAYNEKLASKINSKADLDSNMLTSDFTGQEYYGGYRGYGGVKLSYKKDGSFTAATKRKLGEQLHFEQLNDARKKAGWVGYTDVSDMVEAVTRGKRKLGYGHGNRYWMYPGMQEKEFFAECSSATINNPESLKVIKENFPTAYKEYLKIVDKIVKGDD
ncbi:hypothetical protein [Limosilactobacillus antri]|uniref:hypothetical protein n=1 Tax=Limosilactobacillus antri TaxID=227943 RepID=UPI001F5718B1|nr:hypothetical protein [Limosilactobacillus antri]